LEAIGIGPEDLVIVPTWTFTATAEVIRYLGGHPVFVDVDRETLNLDVAKLEQKILEIRREYGNRLKAIVPVHFAGQACEMDQILDLASHHGLYVVEDAAHAFPTYVLSRSVSDQECRSRRVGSIGHATVFSFYATKTIATGEGGMVTTDDPVLAARMRLMRLHGINRDVWDRYTSTKPAWYYEVVAPGFKYNLSDIASAIGLCQLAKADRLMVRRQEIAEQYNAAFAERLELEVPSVKHSRDTHAWHLYVLRLNLDRIKISRDQFIEEMTRHGVGCSVHYIPLHMQPYWQERYELRGAQFAVASAEYLRAFSLPIYPNLTQANVNKIIQAVQAIAGSYTALDYD
jgi:dTDP-4-amino-4,6-dideoxygalactose transaminase